MELVLVRHGEPARDLTPEEAVDPGLSATGREHAERVAAALAHEQFSALYTSPMRRAVESAAVLAAMIGTEPIVEDDLAEFDQGSVYLHFEDMAEGSPYELYLRGDLSPWGTTAEKFTSRVDEAFARIVAAHPGGRVLVVSHGGVHNAFLGSVLGIPDLHFHEPSYAGISRVRVSRAGLRTIVSMNETAHLNARVGA